MDLGQSDVGSCASDLAALLERRRDAMSVRTLFEVASALFGDRAVVGDASRYIYHVGRSHGFDLPPYPLAGCGEIREFLAEEGVRDVPEWYERKLGVDARTYRRLHELTVVAVSGWEGGRAELLLEGVLYRQDSGFVGLSESGLACRASIGCLLGIVRFVLDNA